MPVLTDDLFQSFVCGEIYLNGLALIHYGIEEKVFVESLCADYVFDLCPISLSLDTEYKEDSYILFGNSGADGKNDKATGDEKNANSKAYKLFCGYAIKK